MSEDFFGDLGKSISRYTKKAVDKTSTMVEAAKISAQISAEQREIDKIYQKIGENIYRRAAEKKITLDDDLNAFIDEIRKRREKAASLTRDLAEVKGQKVCPSCGELIPREVAFCPKCGAPLPAQEEEEPEQTEAKPEKHTDNTAFGETEEKKSEADPKDSQTVDAEFTQISDEKPASDD